MTVRNQFQFIGLIIALAMLTSGASITLADNDRSPRIIRPPDDRADYFATTTMLQGIGDAMTIKLPRAARH